MANDSGRSLDAGKGSSGSRKVDTSGLRRSNRGASPAKVTSSPSSTRKSERLEKRTPTTPPSVTRKSQRLEKQSTPSPLRRSDRGKTHSSSTSSASKRSEKVSSSLNWQKKKEMKQKSINQLRMDSVNVILGKRHVEESISLKRKRMDAFSYKALFTKQRRSKPASDSDNKLDRPDALPRIDSIDSEGSKLLEDRQNGGHESGCTVVEDLREEPLVGASTGAILGSACSLKECDAKNRFVGNCAVCSKRRRCENNRKFSGNAYEASNLVSQKSSFLLVTDMARPEQRTSSHEQKSLHTFLIAEVAKLSESLKLSKNVKHTVQRFLEYVMENHHINNESASILQAFQMSLCWTAASVLKEIIDRRDSLQLAKQILNFQCTYEEASKVYLKLKKLKRKFIELPGNISDPVTSENVVSAPEGITERPPNAGEPPSASYSLQNVKVEVDEKSGNLEPSQGRAVHGVTANDMLDGKIKKIQKKCDKRMLKLRLKHEEEIREFHKMCKEKREQMEGKHQLDLAFIRTTYTQGAMRMDKLKISVNEFEKKIKDHELSMQMDLKELEAWHAAITEEESKRVADWLAKMQSCISQCGDDELHIHGFEADYKMGATEGSAHVTSKGPENEVPRCGPDVGEQCHDGTVHINQASDVILSDISVTPADNAFGCSVPSSEKLPFPAVSDEALEIMPVEASSVVKVEQREEQGQASDRTLEITAQDAVYCSLPADTSPVLFENELEILQVEASSLARAEHPQKTNHLSHRTQEIIPNHSSHGMKGIDSVNVATSSEISTIPAVSDEALEIVAAEASSVAGVKEASQASNRALGINAQEAVSCSLPLETSPLLLNSTSENQLETVPLELSSLARTEQPKEANDLSRRAQETTPNCSSHGMKEIDSVNLTTSNVQNEISSSGQDNEIPSGAPGTAGSEIGNACTLEMGTCVESNIGDGRGNTMGFDGMANQKGGTGSSVCETVISEQLPSVDLVSVRTLTSSELQQGHALQDENFANMETVNTQDEDAPIAGEQTTIVGFASSTPVDSGCIVQSICEAQGIANSEQLQLASNCSSSACSQCTAAEAVHQGHMQWINSLPTSQASPHMLERSVELSHHFNLYRVNGTDLEPNGEPFARSQNTVASSQVENAAELPNQALPQSAPNLATHLPIHQSHFVGSWNPTLPLHAEPLQNELERICKETEHIIKLHASTKLRINAELEEEIARVGSKHEARLKDAESALLLKKTELDSNQNKVVMNKLLAEAFQSKCLDLRPSGISAVQQSAPSSLIQNRYQLSLRRTRRHPCAATSSSAGQPSTGQQTATSPVRSLYCSSGIFPSSPGIPPQISAITPSIGGLRGVGEIRAPAPHLQPFRPSACTSAASISCLPGNIPCQQVPANLPATSIALPAAPIQQLLLPSQFILRQSHPPPPQPQPQPPVALPPGRKNQALSTNRPSESENGVQAGRHTPTLSAVELLIDIDNQASGHLPNILQHLAGSGLNTNSLDPSGTRTSSDGNGCLTTSAIASDVVCLSDDDD